MDETATAYAEQAVDVENTMRVTHLGLHIVSEDVKRHVLGTAHADHEPVMYSLGMMGIVNRQVHVQTLGQVQLEYRVTAVGLLRLDELARLQACIDRAVNSRPDLADDFQGRVDTAAAELEALGMPVEVQTMAEQAEAAAEKLSTPGGYL